MKTARYLSPLFKPLKPLLGQIGIAKFKTSDMGNILVYEDAILKDPLFYKNKVKLSTGLEMLKAAKRVLNNSKTMKTPLMIYHGTADQIVTP